MPSLKDTLSDLIKVEGINTAVVVGRDGFVIDGVTNGAGMDITNATEAILQDLARSDNNLEFLEQLTKDSD